MYVHINVSFKYLFTIASFPVRVCIKNAGEEPWNVATFTPQLQYKFISLHSLHHCPNIADQWRVILKAERLDYINASFVNVGIKRVYIQCISISINDIMLSLCRATSSTKGSLLHKPL